MENKLPLSKPLVMVILAVIFAITIGGYILFFQSQKRISEKDREYDLLKTKVSQTEEGYNDVQKKYDAAVEKIKQLTNDNEAMVQKGVELKTKNDELQLKYDQLVATHEKLMNEMKEKTTTSAPSASTTPSAVEKPSDAHPIQQLQQNDAPKAEPKVEPKAEPTDIPSATITPPSPPPDPEKKASLDTSSALSAGVALGGEEYKCPASEMVTKNLSKGNWIEGSITWFVDYTRRPLNDNEPVQSLFKILYDGQTIACYYDLSQGNDHAWIVIKGSSKNNKLVLKEADGWALCPTKECESNCAKDSLSKCHFMLQKP